MNNWGAIHPFSSAEQAALREHAIFHCCKWDPQIEDQPAVAPFALTIDQNTWAQLSTWAEELAAEVLLMERAALAQPAACRQLGLASRIRNILPAAPPPSATSIRVMRFDFHFTTEGWRITEVNSDVPGGFVEASGITHFASILLSNTALSADPADSLADAFLGKLGCGARVAFVHASAYTDDFQVMRFLSRRFQSRALDAVILAPDQIYWRNESAFTQDGVELHGIFRFFPAEWLPNLPRSSAWPNYFCNSALVQCNHATALLSQSKRMPLLWEELALHCPRWRSLLPETCDPRHADLRSGHWVLKPALGRVGESVAWSGAVPEKDWRSILRSARWFPSHWAAQRKFTSVPLPLAPGDDRHFCLGVYTVQGTAAGIYGRCSRGPVIDYRAQDVPVLLSQLQPKTRSPRILPELALS